MIAHPATTSDESSPPAHDEPVTPDVGGARRRWGQLVVVALLPLILLTLLRVSPYFKLNNGDPFIYIGYSNAFETHIRRFGYTYHSARFGLIFPLRASLALGPVWGYFVLRYLLYLVAVLPMWAVLRRHGSRAALIGPALFIANPVTAQAILTTHHDTIVVPMFTALVCLLLLARRSAGARRWAMTFVAGVAAGMALNANIFAAPLIALAVGAICAMSLVRRRYGEAVLLGAVTVAGTVVVSALGCYVYWRSFGDWNVYRTTFRAAREISDSDHWKTPGLVWLSTRRYAFAPLIAIAFAGLAMYRVRARGERIDDEQRLIALVPVLTLGFLLTHQFVLGGTSVEQAYYYSFLIGPTMLLVAAAAAWIGATERAPVWVTIGLVYLVAMASQAIEIRRFVLFAAIGVALLVAMAVARNVGAAAIAIVLVHLCWGASPRLIAPIEGAGFTYEPRYETAFGDADPAAFEAALLAGDLTNVVPSQPGAPAPLLFWYPTGDGMLDSVQASYHWQTLTVQRGAGPGMPSVSADDLERLRTLQGGFVVMIARTEPELTAGAAALDEAGFEIRTESGRHTLVRGDSTVEVLVARVDAVPSG